MEWILALWKAVARKVEFSIDVSQEEGGGFQAESPRRMSTIIQINSNGITTMNQVWPLYRNANENLQDVLLF